jgi:Stress responsive A/B Barrel Domain
MRGNLFAAAVLCLAAADVRAQSETVLAHDVYFSLNDATPKARAELVAACKKYLTGHEGAVFFSVGTLAAELDRPVNDRDFDIALHVYFKDRAAHDRYQEAPRHKQFIAEQQANWKKVRVFDSTVDLLR